MTAPSPSDSESRPPAHKDVASAGAPNRICPGPATEDDIVAGTCCNQITTSTPNNSTRTLGLRVVSVGRTGIDRLLERTKLCVSHLPTRFCSASRACFVWRLESHHYAAMQILFTLKPTARSVRAYRAVFGRLL